MKIQRALFVSLKELAFMRAAVKALAEKLKSGNDKEKLAAAKKLLEAMEEDRKE